MISAALDFKAENDAFLQLLEPLPEQDFNRKTQFKGWTINDILAHLHFFNMAADLSLRDEALFLELVNELTQAKNTGEALLPFTERKLNGIEGRALLQLWRDYYPGMSERFAAEDPKKRLQWFGPGMSARTSISARLMETWSHAQAIYDLLGVEREEHDRIKNIVVLGVNAFAWTFSNRGEAVPQDKPYLCLKSPSGDVWKWHDESKSNFIEGTAVDFCRVVTQTRNVSDTALIAQGATATRWMAVAQCFAGPPNDPPAPGTRFMQSPRTTTFRSVSFPA